MINLTVKQTNAHLDASANDFGFTIGKTLYPIDVSDYAWPVAIPKYNNND
jgi:hypothetical protein